MIIAILAGLLCCLVATLDEWLRQFRKPEAERSVPLAWALGICMGSLVGGLWLYGQWYTRGFACVLLLGVIMRLFSDYGPWPATAAARQDDPPPRHKPRKTRRGGKRR